MALLKWVPPMGILPASPPIQGGEIPVLFLHGTLGSPGNFEFPARALANRGRAFVAPRYGSHGTDSLDTSLAELSGYVAKLEAQGIKQVDIVGHSAGGLLGLRLAHKHPGFVRGLIGLGAAFKGVPRSLPLNRLSRPMLSPLVRFVAGQVFVDITQQLAAQIPEGLQLISIYSTADRIVPAASSQLGRTIEIAGVRHEELPRQTVPILEALALIK
ncbi:alpha/beta fold hydrolase [Corynebacterium pseudopelargi]|uniref:Thermostable monoacylglycerol lipase n=1 Tax=Corynebacterium pseudopelargi TaxID=2080757 RepID=A0A3G6IV52_9CORY|nr:alpha/beta fold hydrolase [Corynebacterium pseudopelargi]AZA08518.1 Thermostable monoacylglycerol lipase [Corynebacterium pseudopelargi]